MQVFISLSLLITKAKRLLQVLEDLPVQVDAICVKLLWEVQYYSKVQSLHVTMIISLVRRDGALVMRFWP